MKKLMTLLTALAILLTLGLSDEFNTVTAVPLLELASGQDTEPNCSISDKTPPLAYCLIPQDNTPSLTYWPSETPSEVKSSYAFLHVTSLNGSASVSGRAPIETISIPQGQKVKADLSIHPHTNHHGVVIISLNHDQQDFIIGACDVNELLSTQSFQSFSERESPSKAVGTTVVRQECHNLIDHKIAQQLTPYIVITKTYTYQSSALDTEVAQADMDLHQLGLQPSTSHSNLQVAASTRDALQNASTEDATFSFVGTISHF